MAKDEFLAVSYVWTAQKRTLGHEAVGDQVGVADAFRAFERRPGGVHLVEVVVEDTAPLLAIVHGLRRRRIGLLVSLVVVAGLVVVVVLGLEDASFALVHGHGRGQLLVLVRRSGSGARRFAVVDAFKHFVLAFARLANLRRELGVVLERKDSPVTLQHGSTDPSSERKDALLELRIRCKCRTFWAIDISDSSRRLEGRTLCQFRMAHMYTGWAGKKVWRRCTCNSCSRFASLSCS